MRYASLRKYSGGVWRVSTLFNDVNKNHERLLVFLYIL